MIEFLELMTDGSVNRMNLSKVAENAKNLAEKVDVFNEHTIMMDLVFLVHRDLVSGISNYQREHYPSPKVCILKK